MLKIVLIILMKSYLFEMSVKIKHLQIGDHLNISYYLFQNIILIIEIYHLRIIRLNFLIQS